MPSTSTRKGHSDQEHILRSTGLYAKGQGLPKARLVHFKYLGLTRDMENGPELTKGPKSDARNKEG